MSSHFVLIANVLILLTATTNGRAAEAPRKIEIPALGKYIGKKQRTEIHKLFGSYQEINVSDYSCDPPNHCEYYSRDGLIQAIIVLYDRQDRILRIDVNFAEGLDVVTLKKQFGPFEKTGIGESPCETIEDNRPVYRDPKSSDFYFYSRRRKMSFHGSEDGSTKFVYFGRKARFPALPACKST